MIGKTVAHYEIVDLIGKGGMGEVFRARDTKLGREVAIKVLPLELSGDPERAARFDREARTLASLQHPNVASIYGSEKEGNTRFLVMELVEGEDLSERLGRNAIPVAEAIDLAAQLAEGLAAAHAVGVIHRDLKPANIKITSEGKLKILDFGLARAYADDEGSDSDIENSPTITAMTQAGVILGTAAYMSPEQARGRRADYRADIWAFGVVLFEMITGTRLFEGETVSDTLAGVLRADVPWDELPKDTPPTIKRMLVRCLERNPSRRLQAIAEARIALEDLKAGRGEEAVVQTEAGNNKSRVRERIVWAAGVVVLAVLAAMPLVRNNPVEQPLVQSTILPPDGWDFSPAAPFAVSPDGREIAYVAFARTENEEVPAGASSLWIRDLSVSQPRRLTDTDGETYPFWSPDGRWLGFFANGKLNKIEARGGPAVPLCDATDGRGGTWNETGTIVFQRTWNEPLMKIAAGGGKPERVTTLNKEHIDIAHRWPQFLPDGRHFLFYVVATTNPSASEHSGIYVGSIDSSELRQLIKTESRGLYASGHILYRSGSTLMAHPFDVSTLSFTGDPVPVATDIPGGAVSWGGAQFGVSEAGVLIHMRGAGSAVTMLNWRDREGNMIETVGDPSGYWEPCVSHDGTRIAVSIGQDVGDIWIIDMESGMRTRFTFDPADDRSPLWSPDDSQIVFTTRGGQGGVYVRPTSGQGEPRRLFPAGAETRLTDWSSDGSLVFFSRLDTVQGYDVWTFNMATSETESVIAGESNYFDASLSPDGRWLAYVSDESDKFEVYVQSFPEAKGRWMVSSDAGQRATARPRWRSDGRELFYLRGGEVMAVPIAADDNFSFGTPKNLFSVSMMSSSADYGIGDNGQRILTNEFPPTGPGKVGARLIQNWTAALQR